MPEQAETSEVASDDIIPATKPARMCDERNTLRDVRDAFPRRNLWSDEWEGAWSFKVGASLCCDGKVDTSLHSTLMT